MLPMSAAPTMLFRFVDGVLVGAHNARNPTVDEWRRHCEVIERLRHETRGVLIYTEGGGPDSKQRELLYLALLGLPPPPTAILTASAFVRGIITSLNWFFKGQQLAAFAPSNFDGALRHLEVGGVELRREPILQTLGAVAGEIGVTLPPVRPRTSNDPDSN
jgi:hypothetical protein